MAATNGTLIARGKSGKTYTIDLYIPDAVSTKVTFNASGLAASTSADYWSAPEDLTIVDLSAAGAPTAVGAVFTMNGAIWNGNTLRWANQANTLANRMSMLIPIPAGTQIGMLQF